MANNIVLNVLFKKEYLKEFLIAFCGGDYPIEAKQNPMISNLLKPLVSSPPPVPPHIMAQRNLRDYRYLLKHTEDFDERKKILKQITKLKKEIDQYMNGCTVMINLPKYKSIRIDSMNYISMENQHLFELIIHSLFKEIFMLYIDAKMEAGFTKTDAINHFCLRYSLPLNKINFEMLKKKHDRYVKSLSFKINKNKFVGKMSRELSRDLTNLQISLRGAM